MLRAREQHKLDGRLEGLLIACADERVKHGDLAADVREILDDYTHPSENPIKGGKHLLSSGWEARWNTPGQPRVLHGLWSWDEKVERYSDDPLASALEEAFIAMVHLTLDSKTPYFQRKYRKQLIGALSDYLALQGYDIADPSDNVQPEIETLQPDVAKLKRQKKKKTKRDLIREQRNKFSRSRRPQKTWDEIYQAYRLKFPNDDTASPDTLRLSFERNPTDNRQ